MENEVKEKVEVKEKTPKEETKEKETVKAENGEVETKTETETKPEDNGEKTEVKPETKTEEQMQVDNIEGEGNGIPLSEVALKSEVENMINGVAREFQAKLDSVIKENEDLKAKLAEAKGETEKIREKYEVGDFGTAQKQGVGVGEQKKTSAYVSYEDMWNGATNFEKSGD